MFCTRSEKWSENRSSRFEPKILLISFSRGSGPPFKIKSVRTKCVQVVLLQASPELSSHTCDPVLKGPWCNIHTCLCFLCIHTYSQSHLGWHHKFSNAVSKLKAQSSNVSFHWNVAKETFKLWALSFRKWHPKWDWLYHVHVKNVHFCCTSPSPICAFSTSTLSVSIPSTWTRAPVCMFTPRLFNSNTKNTWKQGIRTQMYIYAYIHIHVRWT